MTTKDSQSTRIMINAKGVVAQLRMRQGSFEVESGPRFGESVGAGNHIDEMVEIFKAWIKTELDAE